MLKKIFFIILIAGIILGNPISKNDAQQIALDWFSANTLSKQVSRSIDKIETYQYSNQDALYIVNMSPASFVIIATDDESGTVLAYSDEDSFQLDDLHPALEKLLQQYGSAVLKGEKISLQTSNENATALPDTIEPLLSTKWHQNWPYNKFCPIDSSGDANEVNYRTYAGCVATAMSQIMKYYDYPETGFGSHSYVYSDYGRLSANFDTTTYDWDNMPDAISQFSQEENINAVAQLMYHCGISVDMMYGPNSSGAYDVNVPSAMQEYFNYSSAIKLYARSSYSDDSWINLIKAEINDGRPIYYSGDNGEAGHAFVCDGYENRTRLGYFLHFNWGWSGSGNGYYSIDDMVLSLNYGHDIIVNFAPDGQVPEFQANAKKGVVPVTIQFTDLSDGNPTAWEWDFDMDGTVDSYEQNPSWTYEESGDYTVALKVYYDTVSYQKTMVDYIDAQSSSELYGTISEDRTLKGGIINVLADTKISSGTTLTIMPGTEIQFNGDYLLTIDGNIKAIGTVEDSITFTVTNNMKFNDLGWQGITISGVANDTTEFSYCNFDYVRKSTVIKSINNQNLKITNCAFSDNVGNVIGTWFHNENKLIVDKCLFEDNSNHNTGLFASWGTILTGYYVDGSITNSIFRNNKMSDNGLIIFSNTSKIDMCNNTIIENNHSSETPAIINISTNSVLNLQNSILWNDGYDEIYFDDSNTAAFRNNDIQNGLQEINGDTPDFTDYSGNINVDPQFADDELQLASWSQCIDRGLIAADSIYTDTLDFYGNMRTFNNLTDIGATEFRFDKEIFNVGFKTSTTSGENPLSVTFTDTTELDNIISLKWDFENDGKWDISDSVEVTHSYDRPGIYSVSMLALTADSIPIFVLADSLIEVTGDASGIKDNDSSVPNAFYLNQNYPNPFNPTTTISYGLPHSSLVKISVYNILGKRVKVLADEVKAAGNYQIVWDGKNEQGVKATSGIYFYRMQCENFVTTKKMFFIK